jgi:hypothetical protein
MPPASARGRDVFFHFYGDVTDAPMNISGNMASASNLGRLKASVRIEARRQAGDERGQAA